MRPGEYRLFKMVQLPILCGLTLHYFEYSKVAHSMRWSAFSWGLLFVGSAVKTLFIDSNLNP